MSWVKQNDTPNLNEAKADTIVALPSLMTSGTHPIWTFLEVKGKELDVGPPGKQDEEQASRRQGQQDRQKASEPVEYVPSYRHLILLAMVQDFVRHFDCCPWQ